MPPQSRLTPIAAHDILADGTARTISDAWPDPRPGDGAVWRWLHCDRTDPGFAAWAGAHLPAPVRAGLLQAETRPQCEAIGEGLLVTLRGMNLNPGEEGTDMVSLRAWIGAGLVVTTRARRIFVIDALREDIAAARAPTTPGGFVARIVAGLTGRIEAASASAEDATDAIEETLLDGRPDAPGTGAVEIARIARTVIKLRRYIAPQREALGRLAAQEAGFIDQVARYGLRDSANRTQRVVEELDTVRDRLASLRSHIDSLQAARLGRNGYVLSVIAVLFLPLGFLTGLFGVNVGGMPGTDWPGAFAVLSGAMLGLGLLLWALLRWLRWF